MVQNNACYGSGKVVAVDKGSVLINIDQHQACEGCSLKSGCGHSLLSQKTKKQKSVLSLPLPNGTIKTGDKVEFSLQEHMILKAAVILYLPALVSFILGSLLGFWWGGVEVWSIVGGILGLILGLFFTYSIDKRLLFKAGFQPHIINIK